MLPIRKVCCKPETTTKDYRPIHAQNYSSLYALTWVRRSFLISMFLAPGPTLTIQPKITASKED